MTQQFLDKTEKMTAYTKLVRHRIAARALKDCPDLIPAALAVLDRMEAQFGPSPALHEWRQLLALPIVEVRRRLTTHDQTMHRLRIDSPFMLLKASGLDFTEDGQRRRIIGIAKRVAARDETDVMMKM